MIVAADFNCLFIHNITADIRENKGESFNSTYKIWYTIEKAMKTEIEKNFSLLEIVYTYHC